MSAPDSPPQHIMPRYLSRFACTGSACQETCCAGWRVYVDEKHYKKLKHAMDGSKAERERFKQTHQRVRDENKGPNNYAFIVLNDDQNCPFLDADKLCSTQRKYGEEMLSNTCALYPRTFQQFGDRQEITATLSCPEIARQVLLYEDAMDLGPAKSNLAGRPVLGMTMGEAGDDFYGRCLNEVREIVIDLLCKREFPMATRLFFVTYFGHRTMERFHQGDADPSVVADEYTRLSSPEALAQWAKHFSEIAIPTAVAAAIVVEAFRNRLGDMPRGSFRQLVADVLTGQRGTPLDAPGGLVVDVSPTALWQNHQERLTRWRPEVHARIDQYFENYARNYWLRDWYVASPNLFLHSRRLLIRVAMLRFLLISHPRLAGDFDEATLDQTAVDVFYTLSRGIEHSKSFLDRVETLLDDRGMSTLAHAVFLLKF